MERPHLKGIKYREIKTKQLMSSSGHHTHRVCAHAHIDHTHINTSAHAKLHQNCQPCSASLLHSWWNLSDNTDIQSPRVVPQQQHCSHTSSYTRAFTSVLRCHLKSTRETILFLQFQDVLIHGTGWLYVIETVCPLQPGSSLITYLSRGAMWGSVLLSRKIVWD